MKYLEPTNLAISSAPLNVGEPRRSGRADVVTTTRYYNHTESEITVVTRDGVSKTLQPNPILGGTQELVIEYEFEISSNVIINAQGLFNTVNQTNTKEAAILKEALDTNRFVQRDGYRTYTISYGIELDYIYQNEGSVYYTNLDLVISAVNPIHVPKHPYSDEGRREQMVAKDFNINSRDRFGFSLQIVDNRKEFGDRFININGTVFHIPAIVDMMMLSGIYLTSSGCSRGGKAVGRPVVRRFDFADVGQGEGKIDIHRTYDEALAYGDPVGMIDRTFKQEAAQNKLEEEKLKKEKRERDELLEVKKNENAALKLEIERHQKAAEHARELREMDRKDFYEDRSYNRKDNSDLLKYIPVVISVVLGIKAVMAGK